MSFGQQLLKYHRPIGFFLLIPFIILTASGGLYWVLLHLLGLERGSIRWLIHIHTMSIIGLKKVYPPIMALLILGVMCGGLPAGLRRVNNFRGVESITLEFTHVVLGLVLFIPMSTACITGFLYVIGRLTSQPALSEWSMEHHLGFLLWPNLPAGFTMYYLLLVPLGLFIFTWTLSISNNFSNIPFISTWIQNHPQIQQFLVSLCCVEERRKQYEAIARWGRGDSTTSSHTHSRSCQHHHHHNAEVDLFGLSNKIKDKMTKRQRKQQQQQSMAVAPGGGEETYPLETDPLHVPRERQ